MQNFFFEMYCCFQLFNSNTYAMEFPMTLFFRKYSLLEFHNAWWKNCCAIFCGRPKLKYFLDKMLLILFSVIVAGSGSKLDFHIGPYLSELLLFQGQGHKIRTKWYSFFEAKKVRPFFEWDIKQTMGNRWTMVLEYCFYHWSNLRHGIEIMLIFFEILSWNTISTKKWHGRCYVP